MNIRARYGYAYAVLACVAVFFFAGIMRVEQSALYFGADGVPITLPLETPEGAVLLDRTAYTYFSFWFANATYERAFGPPWQQLTGGSVPATALSPFSYMFPETRSWGVITAIVPGNSPASCELRGKADGAAIIAAGPCTGTGPVARIRVVLTKPTSLREKARLFRDGIVHTCLEYGIARIL